MSDVGCRMSDVGCRMSDVGCRMSDVGCRMSDKKNEAANTAYCVRRIIFFKNFKSEIRDLTSDISHHLIVAYPFN
jgi:hypothetical protein